MGQWRGRKPSPGHDQSNDYLKQENTSGRQHGRAVRGAMRCPRVAPSISPEHINHKGKKWLHSGETRQVPPTERSANPPAAHTSAGGTGTTWPHFRGAPAPRVWDLRGSARKHWHIEWLLQNNCPIIFKVTKVKERLRNYSRWKERHGLCDWDLMPLLCGMSLGWQGKLHGVSR